MPGLCHLTRGPGILIIWVCHTLWDLENPIMPRRLALINIEGFIHRLQNTAADYGGRFVSEVHLGPEEMFMLRRQLDNEGTSNLFISGIDCPPIVIHESDKAGITCTILSPGVV